VLELAGEIQGRGGLRRFAHVSTAYVAGTHRGVCDEAGLDRGQDFHNSYERSKWEAERMVHAQAEHLPIQVFRPSIVVGDELTGWTSSFNVIYTPLRAFARGAMPVVPARRSAPVDIVPVSYVASAILGLADAGPGRTFHLAAGPEATTVGELIDRAAHHLDRRPPRVVSPGVYRRALRPLIARRAGPAQRRWLERSEIFFPYFASKVRFDTAETRAALDPLGIHLPPVADYFERLIDFAVSANWGRRPVGRAQARAARVASGGQAMPLSPAAAAAAA
jgi:long-chain acyl-CoA synthetase